MLKGNRQCNSKRTSFAGFAFHTDAAPVFFNKILAEYKPQPRAPFTFGAGGFLFFRRGEYLTERFLAYTHPLIRNAERAGVAIIIYYAGLNNRAPA